MEAKRIHVMPRKQFWAIRKQGASRALKLYKTKEEAIKNALSFRQSGFDIFIHKNDGSVERWEKAIAVSDKNNNSSPMLKVKYEAA
jgi:hypothetical protein